MGRVKNGVNKKSLLAHIDLERLGIEPLENLLETRRIALEAFKSMRGFSEKSDAGVGYLGIVLRADIELLALKYAKMSAIAIKDMSDNSEKKVISTSEAVDIIKADPFAPKEFKEIPNDRIIDAMNKNFEVPLLPNGKKATE